MRYLDIKKPAEHLKDAGMSILSGAGKGAAHFLDWLEVSYPLILFMSAGIWLVATLTVILQSPTSSFAQSVVRSTEQPVSFVRFLSLDRRGEMEEVRIYGMRSDQTAYSDVNGASIPLFGIENGDAIILTFQNGGELPLRVTSVTDSSMEHLVQGIEASQSEYFFISVQRPLQLRATIVAATPQYSR